MRRKQMMPDFVAAQCILCWPDSSGYSLGTVLCPVLKRVGPASFD